MIITPRDMEIETDQSDSRVEAADADTEELMKGPVKVSRSFSFSARPLLSCLLSLA